MAPAPVEPISNAAPGFPVVGKKMRVLLAPPSGPGPAPRSVMLLCPVLTRGSVALGSEEIVTGPEPIWKDDAGAACTAIRARPGSAKRDVALPGLDPRVGRVGVGGDCDRA